MHAELEIGCMKGMPNGGLIAGDQSFGPHDHLHTLIPTYGEL